MDNKRVFEFSVAVALALVPAVVLYLLFKEMNLAGFENESGIKLGGPAALFFIILITALRYFGRRIADPLSNLRARLKGTWHIRAVSTNKHVATSTCTIDDSDGDLKISGGQFEADETVLGKWTVTATCLTDQSLTYVYHLREAGTGAAWKGIVEITIPKSNKLETIKGMWEVVGPDYRSGHIELTRKPAS